MGTCQNPHDHDDARYCWALSQLEDSAPAPSAAAADHHTAAAAAADDDGGGGGSGDGYVYDQA
jgi:hypothetical protein